VLHHYVVSVCLITLSSTELTNKNSTEHRQYMKARKFILFHQACRLISFCSLSHLIETRSHNSIIIIIIITIIIMLLLLRRSTVFECVTWPDVQTVNSESLRHDAQTSCVVHPAS
jgi:hypothetical protein